MPGIAPGPAGAVVEHPELISGFELGDRLGAFSGLLVERRARDEVAEQRLGIMRGDYTAGERDVGQVLAEGVELRVGRIGNAG